MAKDVQSRIQKLAQRRDKDGFELASLLHAVRYDTLWEHWADDEGEEFTSWTAYTKTLPFSTGTANKFADIGLWLSDEVVPGSDARKRLFEQGWQVAKMLYRIADASDIDSWLDFAEEATWSDFCEDVRREEKRAGLRGPKSVRSFWMDDNQDANVKKAIERERKRQEKARRQRKGGEYESRLTQGDLLEIICLRSMKVTGDVSTKKRA